VQRAQQLLRKENVPAIPAAPMITALAAIRSFVFILSGPFGLLQTTPAQSYIDGQPEIIIRQVRRQ
jgi:hypothetical protein